jgi:hypothetical protein
MRLSVVFCFLVLFVSAPCLSQDYNWGGLDFNATNSRISTSVMNDVIESQTADPACWKDRSRCRPPAPSPSAPKQQAAQARPVKLDYFPSAARSKQNIAGFIERYRKVDPAGAGEMARQFNQMDVIGEISRALRADGFNPNNIAHIYGAYWISLWQASHRDTSTTPAMMAQAVAQQVQGGFARNSALSAFTDSQRQAYAENLMLELLVLESNMQAAIGNQDRLTDIATQMRKLAKTAGFLIDDVTLTDHGFVPAGRK